MISGMTIFYGVERFIAEFWRINPKVLWGWLTTAQIISVFLILFGILWAVLMLKKNEGEQSLNDITQ